MGGRLSSSLLSDDEFLGGGSAGGSSGLLSDDEFMGGGSAKPAQTRNFTDYMTEKRAAQAPAASSAAPTGTQDDFEAPAPAPRTGESSGFIDQVKKGFVAGLVDQNPQMVGNAMDAIAELSEPEGAKYAGELVGGMVPIKPGGKIRPIEETPQRLRDLAAQVKEWGKQGSETRQPSVPSFTSIRTDSLSNMIGDAADYAGYLIGSGVGTSAPSIAAGAAGAAATKSPLGFIASAAGPSYVQNLGDTYGALLENEGVQKAIADGKLTRKQVASIAAEAAIPMAALDAVSLESVVGLNATGLKQTIVKRLMQRVITGGLTEGTTEGIQQVVQEAAIDVAGGDKTLAQQAVSVIDNAIGGALAGGTMSAVASPAAGSQVQEPGAAPLDQTTDIPQGAANAEVLFGQESAGGPPPPSADTAAGGPPPPPAATTVDVEKERPNSPRLTPEDRASPLPNDLIDDGKKIFEEALGEQSKGGMLPKTEPTAEIAASALPAAPPASAEPVAGPVEPAAVDAAPAATPAATPAGLPDHAFLTAGETNPEPTPAQAEAGNYSKRKVKVHGLDVSIENEKGGIRRSKPDAAEPWEVTMPAHYGYIRRTEGADGDHVDVYLGDQPSEKTFIINQVDAKSGNFDEVKVILDTTDLKSAIDIYTRAFSDGRGPSRIGSVVEMPVNDFRDFVRNGGGAEPVTGRERSARLVSPSAIQDVVKSLGSGAQSEQPGVSQLRGQGDQASSQDAQLPELPRSGRGTAVAEAPTRPEEQRRSLRAGEPALGDQEGAGPQPTQEPLPGREGRAQDDRGVGRDTETRKRDDLRQTGEGNERGRGGADAAAAGQEIAPVNVKQRTAPVQKGPRDIIQFLAQQGGVQDFKGELRAIDAHKTFVPGVGKLMREKGVPLDTAREAAAEMGYFDHIYGDRDTAVEKSTVRDLLDVIAETRRGNRQYASGEQGTAPEPQKVDRLQEEVEAVAKEHGLQLDEGLTTEILDRMANGMAADEAIVDILERETVDTEDDTHDFKGQGEPSLDDIPFDIKAPLDARAAGEDREGPQDQGRDRQEPVEGAAREAAPQREQSGSAEPDGSKGEVSAEDRQLLSVFPEGYRFVEGRGQLGRGNWGVASPDKPLSAIWSYFPTKAQAARETRAVMDRDESRKVERDQQEKWEKSLAERMLGGEEPTDSAIQKLGLKPTAGFEWLSPVVQRLFGISKMRVREAMGSALRQSHSDMGALYWVGNAKKALMNAAAWVNAQNAPKAETVVTQDGKREQTVVPGAEKISQGQQAQREADKPLRAKAPQKDAGELFDTQARSERQDELFALRKDAAARANDVSGPNSRAEGRTSNPISPQHKKEIITDTPAFKRWFGDSQVVDDNGDPLVVYHGSNRTFDEFKRSPSMRQDAGRPFEVTSPAYFFAEDRDTAQMFARDKVQIDRNLRGKSGGRTQVEAVYLSAQNPLDLTGGRFFGRVPDPETAEILGEAMGMFEDGPQTWEEVQQALDDPAVIDELRAQGFDGVRLKESDGSVAWAVFEPTQIKSVDNQGTFNPDDPRIRLKVADEKLRPTDAFAAQSQTIGKRLRAELDRLGLKDIGLRISETLGMMVDGKMHAADGTYFRKLISVALDSENPDSTLDHEAIHALRDLGLFSEAEWAILTRKSSREWIEKYGIADTYRDFSRAIRVEEGVAHAYADWQAGARMDGIIAKAFRKIRGILQAISRAFGKDFRTAEDVFAQVASGEIGNRSRGEEKGGEEKFKLQDPQTAEDRQKTMQGMIARGQPLDRALRMPFQFFGGVDERGRWKPGLYVTDKAAKIITTAKIDPEGRFGWLAGPVEAARAGLIDRYGLSPEYIERDRARKMHERSITMEGAEVLKTLADQNVGANEARVLQAILTGEAVTDQDMQMLAAPIRQAIDELGQEAVSLGLVSAESYERNRGTYLHRVYAKHEAEQNNLTKLVSQIMGSKRKKILGDTLKGRGLFWEVPRDQLLRHSSSAQAMRKADTQIGGIEKRIDDMKSRRDVLEGEMEALGREMAAHLGRRMDVADRATIKKMVGESRVTKPSSFQKGQVLEQAVALNRLRDRIEQREASLDKLDGEIAAAEQRIEALSDHLISQSENLSVTKDSKFVVLDKTVDKGDGKPSVAQRVYIPADEQIPERFSGPEWTNRGTWEARQIGKGKVTLWRDYTKAERANMGEILDARYTIGKTYLYMAHDLATGRFYKDIAENEDWTSSGEPSSRWVDADQYRRHWNDREVAWVKVPDSTIADTGGKKRWGALAGKFVRSEIWRDLNEIDVMNRPSTWRMLLTQWKLNKTARSPVVHMNNVMSNLMLMDMQDVRMQDLQAGLRSFINKDQHWKDANEHGVFGADMMTQEIRDNVLKPILDEIEKQGQDGTQNSFLARAGVLGKFADRLWSLAKTADRKMIDLYRVEDDVFRLASYSAGIARGESPEHAAAAAREQFLDYDIRAPWVNAARNSLLPFISYTYRAVPLIARAMATRPWKLAKYAMVAYALNALAYAWDDDGDEDKERASLRDEEQGRTWLGTYRMMRMPFRNSDGLPVFLDVRRWIPGGDVFDTNQGSSAVPIPAPLQFGGPLMLAFELALNKSGFTGDPITNELTDNWWDKSGKVGDYLWKAWLPSAAWVPNSWYWTKIGNALKGATDAKGRPYGLPEAVSSSFGIKMKPQDVETGLFWHYKDIKDVDQALRAEARTLARQRERGLISQKAFDTGLQSLLDKRDRLVERVKELKRDTRKK